MVKQIYIYILGELRLILQSSRKHTYGFYIAGLWNIIAENRGEKGKTNTEIFVFEYQNEYRTGKLSKLGGWYERSFFLFKYRRLFSFIFLLLSSYSCPTFFPTAHPCPVTYPLPHTVNSTPHCPCPWVLYSGS